jgi:hypothetical protein
MSVPENSGVIYEYFVESVNGLPIVLTVEGADANNFSIASDVILRAQILDYENPTDVGANNVYNITIKLTDSAGMSYSYPVVIEVIDVND